MTESRRKIYVCAACGKTRRPDGSEEMPMWDESCSTHAILCWEDSLQFGPNKYVIRAEACTIITYPISAHNNKGEDK